MDIRVVEMAGIVAAMNGEPMVVPSRYQRHKEVWEAGYRGVEREMKPSATPARIKPKKPDKMKLPKVLFQVGP